MKGYYIDNDVTSTQIGNHDMLTFLHAQRTGGTAFRKKFLEKSFGAKNIYAQQYVLDWKGIANVSVQEISPFRVFVGHCNFHPRLLYKKNRFVSILRHPFYRFISLYHYLQKKEGNKLQPVALEYGMKDFYRIASNKTQSWNHYLNNLMCRRICGHPNFDAAKKVIEEEYLAVGCTERMYDLVEAISELFKLNNHNVGKVESDYERYSEYLEDKELIKLVMDGNQEDEKLFRYMNENYFGLDEEKYPWSSDYEETSTSAQFTELPLLNLESQDTRLFIRNVEQDEIIAKIPINEDIFRFDWNEYHIDSSYTYKIQKMDNDGWVNVNRYSRIAPPLELRMKKFTSEQREMIVKLRWHAEPKARRYRVIFKNAANGTTQAKETTLLEEYFDWNGKSPSDGYKYRVQYMIEEDWQNLTSLREIALPYALILKSWDNKKDEGKNTLIEENKLIKRDSSSINVSIRISAPELPKNSKFTLHSSSMNEFEGTEIHAVQRNILFTSKDKGDSWFSTYVPSLSTIKNSFLTSKGTILVCGMDNENETVTNVVRIIDGNVVSSTSVGSNSWHGNFSIDEQNGILMYSEYPRNSKTADFHLPASIFRSYDDGVTWEEVFTIEYPEIRHFHTCTALGNGTWLVSSGDSPHQCRFWRTDDDGENWIEITNKMTELPIKPHYIQKIHRTVVMHKWQDGCIWATDDILGPSQEYNLEGDTTSKSKLIYHNLDPNSTPTILCDIGMHVRSMIDCGSAFIIITEAKILEVVATPQVFIVFKDDLSQAHHLLDIPNDEMKITGSTYSRSSIRSIDGVFFTRIEKGTFSNHHPQIIKWEISINHNN